ncbi:MAG: tripartite tricarboxylate transporter permease, partial [Spirochaetales bacterium]|nr:tripartite tricarboxylate transporter permease [Spirochaetales bacterium]
MELYALITPMTLMLSTLGVIGGIIFGAIPGMTATMALAVFLPLTYALDLYQALALLIGLYVGGISGGLIPAVLLNIPGTPSSITTTFDGYPMTRKGESVRALKIGIVSSLFGGLISAVVLSVFAPALADLAIRFSYVEKFLIILFALTVIASISQGSMLVGLLSGSIGILLSLVGTYESNVGGNDHTRLIPEMLKPLLRNGFSLLPVLIGMFALAAIFSEAERGAEAGEHQKLDLSKSAKFKMSVFKGQIINVFRSGLIGTFVGLLPGVGGSAASVLSYTQAKNFSKKPENLGTGVPEGLLASDTANNGLTGGALITLVSLGIPGDSTTAVLIGAFTLQGVQLGPLFINGNPQAWNSMLSSLIFSNIAMFVLMFFAIKYFAKVVFVPKFILYPIIVVMCTVGAYAINYGIMFDVWTLLIFGLVAWVGCKIKLQIPPLLIGFILGRQLEVYFVKSLESFGTFTIFFTKSKIAWVLWLLILLSIAWSIRS